jgi:hypothetical protein
MPTSRAFAKILGGFRAAACSSLLVVGSSGAGLADIRLEFSSDGKKVDFEVRDTARREAMKQLFSGSPVEIKWVSTAFSEQRIGGKFSGTPVAVVQQLLAGTNFLVVHRDENEVSRVVQLVIVGPSTRELSSTGLAALAAAIKPVSQPKEVVKFDAIGLSVTPHESAGVSVIPQFAGGPAAPTGAKSVPADLLLGRNSLLPGQESNGDATGVLIPPPEGASPPKLVLKEGAGTPPLSPTPSQNVKDLPLTPPVSGSPRGVPNRRP